MAFANDPIKHVVVLMLENRSFDHLLGDLQKLYPPGRLDGIDRNAPRENPYPNDKPIVQSDNAKPTLPKKFDPHHEHPNVRRQIGDEAAPMQGFVADAEAQLGLGTKLKFSREAIAQVMAYFPASADGATDPLPALRTLAREFVVCDRWFASVPGPTWANRFFALTGTAAGHLKMPEGFSDIGILVEDYDMPTIFNRLLDAGRSCKIYHDGVSLSMLLRRTWPHAGIYDGMKDFFRAAKGDARDFPDFAFIEPQYFSLIGHSQNDQHPPHDMRRGDQLIADVYNAIRSNEALWQETLLVVSYDEHGGFYDHVFPPATIAPDATPGDVDNFKFDRLGVRVPTLLISPYVAPGTVDSTIYDHTSLLAYLCRKWDMAPLGARTAAANSFENNIGARFNRNAPLAVPRIDLATTKNLVEPTLEPNGNQRALTLMVDYIHQNLTSRSGLTAYRGFETNMTFSAERVINKSEETLALLKTFSAVSSAPQAALSQTNASRTALIDTKAFAPARPLKVLMVHGVGHGDDAGEWRSEWQTEFRRSAEQAGYAGAAQIEFVFAEFDAIFENYPLDAVTIARALFILGRSAIGGDPEFVTRQLTQRGLIDTVRWTAGMVLQWIENKKLREELRASLLQQFEAANCDIVCAHSLGAMASYEAFRREIAQGNGARYDGKYLLTFGGQMAHPAVQSVFGGRIEPLYDGAGHGFAQWLHLFNPNDHVFTRPLPGEDERTHSLLCEFDIPGDVANHDGAWYLKNAVTVSSVMPVILAIGADDSRNRKGIAAPVVFAKAAKPGRRRALLVGINDYPDPSMRLNGCVNDVYLMSSVLQECGFAPEDIRVLVDRRATRQALLDRLDWLSDGARGDDERVFFYSGHGAQMPVYGRSGEPDRVYETLVPVDFDWSLEHAFTDEEFNRYYSHLPYDCNFVAMFDCCHAGGMTRGGQRVRGIDPPDDIRHRALRWSPARQMWVPRDFIESNRGAGRAFGAERGPDSNTGVRRSRRGLGEAVQLRLSDEATYRAAAELGHMGPYLPTLLFAAKQNELAAEYEHGSVSYGAFTFAMAKQLRKSRNGPTFSRLVTNVRRELTDLGYQQTPEIVGPQAKLHERVQIGRWRMG